MSGTCYLRFVLASCFVAAASSTRLDRLRGSGKHLTSSLQDPTMDKYRVHAFYYLWYGSPSVDGAYKHWNHEILPHWDPMVAKNYPSGTRFKPPEDIHSPFYPLKGPYSSSNSTIIKEHMRELKAAGVNVLAVSWWGPKWRKGSRDTQGVHTDEVLPLVMEVAEAEDMKIAFHLEPYPGRSVHTVPEDLRYLMDRYGNSPAVLRINNRPLYYVYDSYHIPAKDWYTILQPGGNSSVRGTRLDGVFLGLWVDAGDGAREIEPAGFDGFYTYFASEQVSYGANPQNWPALQRWAASHKKLFVASIGAGYDDSKIRPWNAFATRPREGGARYSRYWEHVLDTHPDFVSITSYNEWGEGTQIEPARVFPAGHPLKEKYQAYGDVPDDEYLYLNLTHSFIHTMLTRVRHARGDMTTQPQKGKVELLL